jgi:metal-responsive CopG/Arc/MetJ family transcriptional regulator
MKKSPKPRKTSNPEKKTAKAAGAQSVTFRMQPDIIATLNALAKRKGMKRSPLIQFAIAEYLEREQKK